MPFAIELIHCQGGSRVAVGETIQECREMAAALSKKFPASYFVATLPYEIFLKDTNPSLGTVFRILDVSIPFDIRKALGMELRMTYEANNG